MLRVFRYQFHGYAGILGGVITITTTLRAPGACAARAKARLQAQKWAHDNGVTLYLQNLRVINVAGNLKAVVITAQTENWNGPDKVEI